MYRRHWDVLGDLVRQFHCVRPAGHAHKTGRLHGASRRYRFGRRVGRRESALGENGRGPRLVFPHEFVTFQSRCHLVRCALGDVRYPLGAEHFTQTAKAHRLRSVVTERDCELYPPAQLRRAVGNKKHSSRADILRETGHGHARHTSASNRER